MFKADGSRRDFPVTKPRIVVGRTNDCDLRIPLSSVSRQHCEFRLEGGQFKVQDLGSSNGTFRNNTRIAQETPLKAGDEIVIGPVVFTVIVDGKPASVGTVRSVPDRNRQNNGQAASSASAVTPQRLSFDTGVGMPSVVETENHSPTVDLDDPIAALEALAAGSDQPAPAVREAEDEAMAVLESFDDDDEDDNNPFAALAAATADDGAPVVELIEADNPPVVPVASDDDDDMVIPLLDEEDEDLPRLADDDD